MTSNGITATGSDDNDRMSQFIQSLECSVQLSLQLERTLLDETRAIEMRDPDDLLRVVTDKQNLVVQLEAETGRQKQLGGTRRRHLHARRHGEILLQI